MRTLNPLLSVVAESWENDTLALAEISENRPLSVLTDYLLEKTGVISHFALDRTKLKAFLGVIESGYSDDNPYHNKAHAASVVHFMYMLLSRGGIAEATAPMTSGSAGDEERQRKLVMLAGLLAAAIHDYQHAGLNNGFLVTTNSPKAIRYNDKSPNENSHLAAAFETLLTPEFNFLEGMAAKEFKSMRSMVIDMVLGTDMARNGQLVQAFQQANASTEGSFVPASPEEAALALQIALKCADVGHLALGWTVHMRWVQRLEQEFFRQGDQEKKLGMPEVSFLMDSDKPGVSETQVGFFNFVALPLFRALAAAFPNASPMMNAVEANFEKWSVIQTEAQDCS